MKTEEILGKTITNIYSLVTMDENGLDSGECFIELDNRFIIDIPFGFSDDIWLKTLNQDAVSLFADLSDYPVYHVNNEKKSIGEIAAKYQRQKRSVFNKLRKFLFGVEVNIKEYKPYKVEYKENKLKHIKDKKIVDFLWYNDDSEKGFFLLDNGYIITETIIAPNGTGRVGLNLYETINDLIKTNTNDLSKLTDKHVNS